MKKIILGAVVLSILAIIIGLSSFSSWEEHGCFGYRGGYSYLWKRYERFNEEWEEGQSGTIQVVSHTLFTYQFRGQQMFVRETWIIVIDKSIHCPPIGYASK